MYGSCHLDRAMNVEIVVDFFIVSEKCILGLLQDIEKVRGFH
jgi:hypothetical protein